MTTKHTQGPWETSCYRNKEWDVCEKGGGDMIADLSGCNNQEANAALIAAAPDLLAACRYALECLRNANSCEYFNGEKLETMLETAIEQAQGEQA